MFMYEIYYLLACVICDNLKISIFKRFGFHSINPYELLSLKLLCSSCDPPSVPYVNAWEPEAFKKIQSTHLQQTRDSKPSVKISMFLKFGSTENKKDILDISLQI
jgi:hypothetical protein